MRPRLKTSGKILCVIDENSQDWLNPDAALVLLDPFDRPIEYFCNPYAGDPSSVDQRKSTGVNGATPPIPQMRPSLADIIRLRPSAFGSESEFDGNISADVFNFMCKIFGAISPPRSRPGPLRTPSSAVELTRTTLG